MNPIEENLGEARKLTVNNGKRSIAIIPCFNEALTIGSIILKAKSHVDDVLVIDDGSSDDTIKIAKAAGAKVISHNKNRGKSAGIRTGFRYAMDNQYDFVITIDGDGQHNPNEIPYLLNSLKNNGHDIILGVRYGNSTEMPLWRKMGKRILDYTTSIGNGGFITDSQCGFRAFNKNAIQKLINRLNGNSFSVESEQLIRAHEQGLHISTEKISCKYKNLNTSTKVPSSHGLSVLSYLLKIIAIKYPIFFIGIPGLFLILIGMILGLITLQIYDQTNILNITYAVLISSFFIVGTLSVFASLLLNRLYKMFKMKRNVSIDLF